MLVTTSAELLGGGHDMQVQPSLPKLVCAMRQGSQCTRAYLQVKGHATLRVGHDCSYRGAQNQGYDAQVVHLLLQHQAACDHCASCSTSGWQCVVGQHGCCKGTSDPVELIRQTQPLQMYAKRGLLTKGTESG